MDRQQQQAANRDNHSNQGNPNHAKSGPGRPAGYTGDQSNINNRSEQKNPNNDKYQGK